MKKETISKDVLEQKLKEIINKHKQDYYNHRLDQFKSAHTKESLSKQFINLKDGKIMERSKGGYTLDELLNLQIKRNELKNLNDDAHKLPVEELIVYLVSKKVESTITKRIAVLLSKFKEDTARLHIDKKLTLDKLSKKADSLVKKVEEQRSKILSNESLYPPIIDDLDYEILEILKLRNNSQAEFYRWFIQAQGKAKSKELTPLVFFRNNQDNLDAFLNGLRKGANPELVGKDWNYGTHDNTIVSCLKALFEYQNKNNEYIVDQQYNKRKFRLLLEMLKTIINTPISIDNFRKWDSDIDDVKHFAKRFKTIFKDI